MRRTERAIIRSSSVRMTRTVTRALFAEITSEFWAFCASFNERWQLGQLCGEVLHQCDFRREMVRGIGTDAPQFLQHGLIYALGLAITRVSMHDPTELMKLSLAFCSSNSTRSGTQATWLGASIPRSLIWFARPGVLAAKVEAFSVSLGVDGGGGLHGHSRIVFFVVLVFIRWCSVVDYPDIFHHKFEFAHRA